MKPIFRQRTKGMNKLEARYALYLEMLKKDGQIIDFRYEEIKLKLAPHTFWTPDFWVVYKDHFEFHETKGYWEAHSRIKIKVAAEQFSYFRFKAIRMVKGIWKEEYFE